MSDRDLEHAKRVLARHGLHAVPASGSESLKVIPFGSNRTRLVRGDSEALVSYETIVAYHESGSRPLIPHTSPSRTTTRHINAWLEFHDFDRASAKRVSMGTIDKAARDGGIS